jgi:hypothetical protein
MPIFGEFRINDVRLQDVLRLKQNKNYSHIPPKIPNNVKTIQPIEKLTQTEWFDYLFRIKRQMKNPITELFINISDEELRDAIQEIMESDKTGIIKENGVVRKYGKLTGELTGGFTTTDFYMVQINLLKEAAFRWWYG